MCAKVAGKMMLELIDPSSSTPFFSNVKGVVDLQVTLVIIIKKLSKNKETEMVRAKGRCHILI